MLQGFQLLHQGAVVHMERQAGIQLPVHQRGTDEDGAAIPGVDPAVVAFPAAVDRQPVHRGALPGHHAFLAGIPAGVAVVEMEEVARGGLDPGCLHRRRRARKHLPCLQEFRAHDPPGGVAAQDRTGEDLQRLAERAGILRPASFPAAPCAALPGLPPRGCRPLRDVGQETGQKGPVNARGVRRSAPGPYPQVLQGLLDAGLQCPPFPHAEHRQEVLGAPAVGLPLGLLLLDPTELPPDIEQDQEIRILPAERLVPFPGLLLLVGGALPGIGQRQRRGDDHRLLETALTLRCQQHAGDPRVHRDAGDPAAERGDPLVVIQRPEFHQVTQSIVDLLPARPVDEREGLDVADRHRLHSEDDIGQGGPADFRIRVGRPRGMVFLAVQADADSAGDPAAAARTLIRGCAGDLLHRQALQLACGTVPADPGKAAVDDIPDAGHGQGGFRDVGGQNDAGCLPRPEDSVLLGGCQAGVQRQDLDARLEPLAEPVGSIPDLPFARQEHQGVAGGFAVQLGDRLADARGYRLEAGLVAGQGAVAHLYRVQATGNRDRRGVVEVRAELFAVQGGGGDDQPEFRALLEYPPAEPEEEIDVQRTLVGLVDDQHVVALEKLVTLELGQQHAVGQHPDVVAFTHPLAEPHPVADGIAERGRQLLGNPFRNRAGGDAPWLSLADHAVHAVSRHEADLGDLRALAGTGLPADHQYRMFPHQFPQLLRMGADGKLRGKFHRRQVPCAQVRKAA